MENVYIKGEGDAVLTEQLSNGPDLANNFENEFLPIGFLTQHFGTANPLLAPYIKQALQYVTAQQQGPYMQKAGALAMAIGAEVPLVFQPSLVGYNKNVVGGTVQAPLGPVSHQSGRHLHQEVANVGPDAGLTAGSCRSRSRREPA